jgi:NADPH:quinone reductase-like Zn-dependent oxidoreductase
LEVVEVPRPEPAAGEVRIKVQAAGVNPIDVFTGRNAGYEQSMRLPFIPGWDVAGVVDALGYGVTRHIIGARVFGLAWFPYPAGTYAQYVTAPAYQLTPMPTSTSFTEAASLPMAALTAWQMLAAADVRKGQRVLISGATGGVGHLAVQLAADRGATVVALGRPKDHQLLADLGAHDCIDYTDAQAMATIGPVDAVIDLVGHDVGRSLIDHVVAGGNIALATAWSVPEHQQLAAERGVHAHPCLVEPDPTALGILSEMIDAGRLRVVVGAHFPLDRVAEAQQWMHTRQGFGKVTIVMEPDGQV